MTMRMREFLLKAATASPGKGIPVERHDRRIAGKAASEGYGMIIQSIFAVFILNDQSRAALAGGE